MVFEGGSTIVTPVNDVLLTENILLLQAPFDGARSYESNFTFVQAGTHLDRITFDSFYWDGVGENYQDRSLLVWLHGYPHFMVGKSPEAALPAWNSPWSTSFGAAARFDTTFIGRFAPTSFGDFVIMASEWVTPDNGNE